MFECEDCGMLWRTVEEDWCPDCGGRIVPAEEAPARQPHVDDAPIPPRSDAEYLNL